MIAAPLRPGRPHAILFDWDNTLVDSWPVIHEALNRTLIALDHAPWTLADSKARVRLSLRDSFPLLFGARWEEARRIYLDAFQAIHLERLAVLPGVAEMLEVLAGEGIYLGVVSNKTGRILRREAAALGWNRYFKRLIGAGDAAADKPHSAPVVMALDGSGVVNGAPVWFVGDTAVDMQCAIDAGCVPVLLGPLDPTSPEFAIHKPQLAFRDCGELFVHMRTL